MEEIIKLPIFKTLTNHEKQLLLENCTVVDFDKREAVFKQGSFAVNSYYILEGYCKVIYKSTTKKRMLAVLHQSEFIGKDYASKDYYPYSFYALTSAKMLVIPILFLNSLCESNFLFYKLLNERLENYLINNAKWLVDTSLKNVQGSVAMFLLKYYSNEKYAGMPLSREEMSELIGYSRENVIHILKNFCAEKLISSIGKNIKILNKEKLEEIVRHS
ncbi:MAG: Crp/Fnr family transcriptional regulator [Flavobacteriaceae bacterium]|jgi:CRP-like cAMP-binding protein|nr:Crp/Fnr family transcriptional regulator [Flavobacteriaceae bacterium]